MRNLKQFMLLIMTVSLVTLSGCKSDDDGGSGGSAPSGTLAASVDGASYQSVEVASSATLANGNLIIIAANSDGNSFSMTINGYSGPGTYPLGGGANIFNIGSYQETMVDLNNPQNSTTEIWQAPFDDMQVGEINISEETDTNVTGTFEFMCKNVGGDQSVKDITNGSFNLGLQTL